jgi:hypothetical protein
LIVRLSRPLPGAFSAEQNRALAHRHLDLLVPGLRVESAGGVALPGPALSLDELHQLPKEAPAEKRPAS